MRVYLDEQEWKRRVDAVPQPLRQRELDKLQAEFSDMGFIATESGRDETGAYIDIHISPDKTLQDTLAFTERAAVAAVRVQAQDVTNFLGRTPISLGVKRAIEFGDVDFGVLAPDEIAEALNSASWSGLNAVDGLQGSMTEDAAELDLVMAGLLDQNEVDQVDQWLNPPQTTEREPAGVRDFFPEPDEFGTWS